MIVKTTGVITNLKKTVSSKGREYLNGQLKSSTYDFNYLTVGIRCDNVPVDTPCNLVLDISQSWLDVSGSDKKDCRTHISVVGVEN